MTRTMSLGRALERLEVSEAGGLLVLPGGSGNDGVRPRLDARLPTLISLPLADRTRTTLLGRYPDDWDAALVWEDGIHRGALGDLLRDGHGRAPVSEASYLYLPPLPWDADLKDFRTLVDVVAWLRAPDGCPWDRAQTHRTLAPYLLEETYEALEEIDTENLPALGEELGDILLQVALHSEIAREEGEFDIGDVVAGLVSKLVRRHPHVFGDATARSAEEVVARWEVLKSRERNGASLLTGMPRSLPALSYAQRVQERAGNIGFDWPSVEGVLDKVAEEVRELEQAADPDEREAELGDLLFSLTNLGRRWGLDVEAALRHANRRFVSRFQTMEELARERGRDLAELPLEEQDALWEEAKRRLAE